MKVFYVTACRVCPYIRYDYGKGGPAHKIAGQIYCSGMPLDKAAITDNTVVKDNCPLENAPTLGESKP